MSFSTEDDTDDENKDSFQSEDEEVSDQLSNDGTSDNSKSDQDKSFSATDSERSSSVSPWDLDPELQAIKGAMFISIASVQNTEHSRCAIHNKVIEPHAIS